MEPTAKAKANRTVRFKIPGDPELEANNGGKTIQKAAPQEELNASMNQPQVELVCNESMLNSSNLVGADYSFTDNGFTQSQIQVLKPYPNPTNGYIYSPPYPMGNCVLYSNQNYGNPYIERFVPVAVGPGPVPMNGSNYIPIPPNSLPGPFNGAREYVSPAVVHNGIPLVPDANYYPQNITQAQAQPPQNEDSVVLAKPVENVHCNGMVTATTSGENSLQTSPIYQFPSLRKKPSGNNKDFLPTLPFPPDISYESWIRQTTQMIDCIQKYDKRVVYVKGLSHNLIKSGIFDYFYQFGCIENVEVHTPTGPTQNKARSGYAFITYSTPKAAMRVVQHKRHYVNNHELETQYGNAIVDLIA